jgi:hypothetical protein
MWAVTGQSEFFAISLDSNTQLNCAPFGNTSVTSPSVAYGAFNEMYRQEYGWMHVVCQYTYMKNITGYLHGTGGGLDQNYTTSLASNPNYVPADSYVVYMGNSYLMNNGMANAMVKEVKVWGYARAYADI